MGVFERLNSEFDPESTARELTDLFLEKEKKEIARLHAMVEFFETDQCLAKSLFQLFWRTVRQKLPEMLGLYGKKTG